MIELASAAELNLLHTLTCGQCFRWKQEREGHFYGAVSGRAAHVWTEGGKVLLEASDEDPAFWKRYFGMELDYSAVLRELAKDSVLKNCFSAVSGIRILRQDIWETVVSFICSANNNIPRIEKILQTMCECFGDRLEWKGRIFYTFPAPQKLALLREEDLSPLRAGYRGKYILGTARMAACGEICPDALGGLSPSLAKKELCRLPGVGPKVADCIMLFALGRYEVFPKDVWTRRILQEVYRVAQGQEDAFTQEHFGAYAGIAQQYLYHYYRTIL